uniref:Ig-like domain-containing protein n=1 Tax=Amphiprion percula TaxID=161767 RepID=A0A3P8TZM1_AMPPE
MPIFIRFICDIQSSDITECLTVQVISGSNSCLCWFLVQFSVSMHEGGNITLPASVGDSGLLISDVTTLAVVHEQNLDIWQERFRDRIVWDRTTGLFTITALQRDDAGIYTLLIQLRILYDGIMETHKSSSFLFFSVNESCFLLCSVDKAAEVTLWWSRDEEMLNQISSTDSLLLTVTHQNLSSSYRCEAGNPAENKTLQVDVETLCSRLNLTAFTQIPCLSKKNKTPPGFN